MPRARSAVPMVARCARHQLPEDPAMFAHRLLRHGAHRTLRPNLFLTTGPPPARRTRRALLGPLLPMLALKAG